jgi:hypothetical protein
MPAAALAGKSHYLLALRRAEPSPDIAVRQNRVRAFDRHTARRALSCGMLDPNQGRARTGHGLFQLTFKKYECDFVRRTGEEERS